MEDINLQGVQIIDHQRLKQSGRLRLVIELTEKDALQYCGSFAVAEQHEHIANVNFKFTEAQGENNGYEESLKKAANNSQEKPKAMPESVFLGLRRACIDYTSEVYYERLKQFLGVKHLKDLAKQYGDEQAYAICKMQMRYLFYRTQGIHDMESRDAVAKSSKPDDFKVWDTLFTPFNRPPNAKQNVKNR